MITENSITFILGAGASVPFGFPTGFNLSNEIIQNCYGRGKVFDGQQVSNLMSRFGFTRNHLSDFANQFLYSGTNSIDEFLRDRKEWLPLGKKMIALTLLPYEVPDNILEFKTDNWYRFIWSRIKSESLAENTVNFITYNYDRSLEFFLYSALKNSFSIGTLGNMSHKEQMRRMKIIHLHGKLGDLEFELESNQINAFTGIVNHDTLSIASNQIKIVHEDVNEKYYQEAYEVIENSKYVYFLGFGFHPINMERLLKFGWRREVEIDFTTYGMTDVEKEEAKNMFRKKDLYVPIGTNLTVSEYLKSLRTLF